MAHRVDVGDVQGEGAGGADVDAQAAALASLERHEDGTERRDAARRASKWGVDERG